MSVFLQLESEDFLSNYPLSSGCAWPEATVCPNCDTSHLKSYCEHSQNLKFSIVVVNAVLTSWIWAMYTCIDVTCSSKSICKGTSLRDFVFDDKTFSILSIFDVKAFIPIWIFVLVPRIANIWISLSIVGLLKAVIFVQAPWKCSDASSTIQCPCVCKIWIPVCTSWSRAWCYSIRHLTLDPLESMLWRSVLPQVSTISILFLTISNSSSRISFSSLHTCITCMTCCASSKNWLCTKSELAFLITSCPCTTCTGFGSSCDYMSRYSARVSSIHIWFSGTHWATSRPAGNFSFSSLEALGARSMLVYVNCLQSLTWFIK